MNISFESNASDATVAGANQTSRLRHNGTSTSGIVERQPAQKVINQVDPTAAKGDDDLMSQEEKLS